MIHDDFKGFIGRRLIGVLIDAYELKDATTNRTLVFDDGRGLVIASSGNCWIVQPRDIRNLITKKRTDLEKVQDELRTFLDLAEASPLERLFSK